MMHDVIGMISFNMCGAVNNAQVAILESEREKSVDSYDCEARRKTPNCGKV